MSTQKLSLKTVKYIIPLLALGAQYILGKLFDLGRYLMTHETLQSSDPRIPDELGNLMLIIYALVVILLGYLYMVFYYRIKPEKRKKTLIWSNIGGLAFSIVISYWASLHHQNFWTALSGFVIIIFFYTLPYSVLLYYLSPHIPTDKLK